MSHAPHIAVACPPRRHRLRSPRPGHPGGTRRRDHSDSHDNYDAHSSDGPGENADDEFDLSAAFLDKAAGFCNNHHPVVNDYFNNTGFGNRPDFDIRGVDPTGTLTAWTTKTFTASLNAGSHTVRLEPTAAGGLPDIDHLTP